MTKKPLCLVTGACGFMGTHMVEVLAEAGYQIRATDLPAAYPEDNKKRGLFPSVLRNLGVDFVGADLTDKQSLAEVVKDVEIIFHIAGLFSHQFPLAAGWKTTPSPSTHTTLHDLINHLLRLHLFQHAGQPRKAIPALVFLHIDGIDDPPEFGGHGDLLIQE